MINIEKKLCISLKACFIDDFEFNGKEFIVDLARDEDNYEDDDEYNDEYNKALDEVKQADKYLYQYCTFKATDWWFGDINEWNKQKQELSSNDKEPLLAYNLAKTKYPLRAWITNVEVIENITYLYFIGDIKISINNLKKWSLSFTAGLEENFNVKYDIVCNNGIFEKTEEIRFIREEE